MPFCRYRHSRHSRQGFTLLEVMIATAVTLLMMLSLARGFKVIGDSIKQGRSVLELNNRLRNVVHRLRSDLDNLTAIPSPPADPSSATGYLQIFDGSTTDYTATTQGSLAVSRLGDVDDILMATVRAGDVWFTGKVPQYVLLGVAPTTTNTNLVSIASQHAEIAVFAQPLVTNVNNPNLDPGYFLTSSDRGAVNFQDVDPLPNFPDSLRLHYRVLPIRPDLNLATGNLPGGLIGVVRWTLSHELPGQPSPLCDMASAHFQCDLSMRRVFNPGDGLANPNDDYVAANSLEDLVDPANRFAHVQLPLPGTNSTTMPLLALGTRLEVNGSDPLGTLLNAPISAANPFRVGSGFLHPAFALLRERTGEDLLASDVLAFDIKVFDPDVPLLGMTGADGDYGVDAVDDDQNGTFDDASEFGWAGSDDLVLSPSDPGYAAALASGTVVGYGDYVDLAWAQKLVAHSATISAANNVWSPFSGYSLANFNANGVTGAYTDALLKSGNVLLSPTAPNTYISQVLQPCYDTWNSRYEGDNIVQAALTGRFGVCRVDGTEQYAVLGGSDASSITEAWRQANRDAGTDGIDNNASGGVDDASEMETSAPFPTQLRGLKISVRMEDPRTRQVKQMSTAKEFITQ